MLQLISFLWPQGQYTADYHSTLWKLHWNKIIINAHEILQGPYKQCDVSHVYLKALGRWSTRETVGMRPVSPARDASSPSAPRASSLRKTSTTACRATRSSLPCSVCTARRYSAFKRSSTVQERRKTARKMFWFLFSAHHHWRCDLPWPALAQGLLPVHELQAAAVRPEVHLQRRLCLLSQLLLQPLCQEVCLLHHPH